MKWLPQRAHIFYLFCWIPLTFSASLSAQPPSADATLPSAFLEQTLTGLTDNIPELLLKTVNNKIAGKIIAQNFDYEAPSTVRLYGVKIQAPNGSNVVDVRQLKISLSVKALFSGELLFEDITLQEPTVSLKSTQGQLNIQAAFKTKGKGSTANDDKEPLSLHIEKLNIVKGTFKFENDEGMKLKFASLKSKGKMDLVGDSLMAQLHHLEFKSGRFENSSIAVNLGATQIANTELLGKLIRFQGLNCALLGGNVSLNGQVRTKGSGSLKLNGSFQLPKNAWPEKIEPLAFKTPPVSGQMKITGPLKAPVININTSFGAFEAYDYQVSSGTTNVQITPTEVHILKITTQLASGGTIGGEVHYNFDTKTVLLENVLNDVPLKALVPKTKIAKKLQGKVSGELNTEIALKNETIIDSTYNLTTKNFHLSTVALPYYSRIKGRVNYNDRHIKLSKNRISAEDFSLSFNGDVSLKNETVKLATLLKTGRIKDIVDSLPEALSIGQTKAEGNVSGTFDNYLYNGQLIVDSIQYDTFTLTQITTPLSVTPSAVTISNLQAETAGGLCELVLTLDLSDDVLIGLDGHGQLQHLQLASIDAAQPKSQPLTGSVSTEFQIAGHTKAPRVHFGILGHNIEYSDIHQGELQVIGELNHPRLFIERLQLEATAIHISSTELEADLEHEVIDGLIQINTVLLETFTAPEEVPLKGQLAGWLKLSGHLKAPDARAGLLFSNLAYDGRSLGDGKFRIQANSITPGETIYEIAVAGLVTSPMGTFGIQNYYHTETEDIIAKVRLTDIDLQHYGNGWSESVPPLDGILQGQVDVSGTLSVPHIDADLNIPQLGLLLEETPLTHDEDEEEQVRNTLSPYKYLGPVQLHGNFEGGIVDAQLCAFPNFSQSTRARTQICTSNERFQVLIQGNYESQTNSLLLVKTELDFEQLADYIPSLAKSDISTGLHLTSNFNLKREQGAEKWNMQGSGRVLYLGFQSPQSPHFVLKQPFALQFTDNSVRLNTPMELQTESGQLTVSGFYTPEKLDLIAQGQVALAFASLFTDSITQSEGLLDLKVHASGTAEKPFIEGLIQPKSGAFVHLASLDQDLIFQSGALAFSQEKLLLNNKEEDTIRISFVDLKMKTDTGDLSINGDSVLSPPGHSAFENTPVHSWNIEVQGSGLSYQSGHTQLECATHLVLHGSGNGPQLKGQIEVTEGQLQKEFQLNNFVMTAANEEPSAPLHKTLYFLEDLKFDVAIAIQSFEVQTLLNSFALETDVQGRLQLQQTLREPALTGSVELTEGEFIFPYAEFELASASVDFHQTPGLFIDPHFRLEAWAEITQREVPQLQQDTLPLVLVLDGNLEQMQLNFRTEDGSEYSRTDLLALVLLGYLPSLPGEEGEGGPSTDNALRAVSRELTSSTRKQVEDVLRKKLGADVQVDLYADSSGVKTGVRWHLGKRLELEGAGGIQFGSDSSAQNNDLRLRFLIFDHLPWGKELFLEGGLASPPSTDQNASPRGDIRLTYRILEQ